MLTSSVAFPPRHCLARVRGAIICHPTARVAAFACGAKYSARRASARPFRISTFQFDLFKIRE